MAKKNIEKTFWLSYDLGLKGDYQGLYRWLDSVKAMECGNNFAVFKKNDSLNVVQEIETDLSAKVTFKEGDRVYLIWKDAKTDKIKGQFIKGHRKPAPWEGYSDYYEKELVDSE
jgi:hypothetical protein